MDNKNLILNLVRQDNPVDPLSYVHDIVKEHAFNVLCQDILNCTKCNLSNTDRFIPCGDINSPLLVILDGSAASKNKFCMTDLEEKSLSNALSLCNKSIDDLCYIGSVCCSYQNAPGIKSRIACKPHRDKIIEIIKPKSILLIGNIAYKSFFSGFLDKNSNCILHYGDLRFVATYILEDIPGFEDVEDTLFINSVAKAIDIAFN